jgi:hypothetical protein
MNKYQNNSQITFIAGSLYSEMTELTIQSIKKIFRYER